MRMELSERDAVPVTYDVGGVIGCCHYVSIDDETQATCNRNTTALLFSYNERKFFFVFNL